MNINGTLSPAEVDDSGDISKTFTCFLCNGYTVLLGLITLEPKVVQLSMANGHVLEVFPYSSLESVNEEEPVTGDTLIFNLGIRQVYASSLLRKDKLVKFFKSLDLYQEDVRFPANVFGFYRYSADALSSLPNMSYERPLMREGVNPPRPQPQLDSQLRYSNLNNYSDNRVEKPLFERQRQVTSVQSAEVRARNTTPNARREQSINADVPLNVDANLETLRAMFPDHSVDVLKRALLVANCDVNEAVSAIIKPDTSTNNFNV